MTIDKKIDTDVDESLKLLTDFLTKNSINIEDFKNFNFNELRHCKGESKQLYACPNGRFDPDNTQLAKAVYILLWKKKYRDLSLHIITTDKEIRGDTINSFRTVFGNPPTSIERNFYYPDELCSKYIKSKIEFYKKYHTIGNFVILPNNRLVRGNGRSMTINKYRNSCYKDNFSRFLNTMESFYKNRLIDLGSEVSNGQIQRWSKLFTENEFFFKLDEGDFKNLYTTLILEEYLNNPVADYPLYSSLKNQQNINEVNDYFTKVINYGDTSIQIINLRANKMIDRLITLYPELLTI